MAKRLTTLIGALALLVTLAHARSASANARGVGLGVAAGVDLYDHQEIDMKTSFSWGFFVDIPLLDTFYITPAAMVYELELPGSDDKVAATDIDMNFKFVVPLHPLSLGFGVTAGLTTGLGDYYGHYGALGYLGWNIVANLDLFAMVQYKRLTAYSEDYNNIHAYGGVMFRF